MATSGHGRAARSLGWTVLSAAMLLAGPAQARQGGLSPMETLGSMLFDDTSLSHPAGQACASCHAEEAGFRFPDSRVNRLFGVPTGAFQQRVGPRSVPTISYVQFGPDGPPFASPGPHTDGEMVFIGGFFWDGRANTLEHQAHFPFFNPNEMNNLVHNLPDPDLLKDKVRRSREADLFRLIFGQDIFSRSAAEVLDHVAEAIAAYERSSEVSPFTSRYDDYVRGTGTLTDEELDGLRLMVGTWTGREGGPPYPKFAQCVLCHGIPDRTGAIPDLWTKSCYANIGTPKNPNNPFYTQTNQHSNPAGYNPAGRDYVDIGFGAIEYPYSGLPPGNMGPGSNGYGDFLFVNGTFKAPTLRNVDKRPYPGFVKPYMHNGVFKDLKSVVHFYNTRNLTTVPGEVIDFTRPDPYKGLKGTPLWPRPEWADPATLQNASGAPDGQVGNLGLTDEEEDHIVALMKALTDR